MRLPLNPPTHTSWTMSDGYVLRGRVWRPSSPPRGRVLYLHGIQSHGGWFEWSASLLAETGYVVVLPDRRGSGLNEEARGDVPHRRRWLDDLDEVAAQTDEAGIDGSDALGVSWGGKLALAWALRSPAHVRRLLLIAPGVVPAVGVGIRDQFRIAWAVVRRPEQRFPIPLDDPALFTQNTEAQEFIFNDTLKLTHATARFLYQSARLDRDLAGTAPGSLQATVTLVLASDDRIIRNAPTAEAVARLAAHGPAATVIENAAHTLEFEADVAGFEMALRDWVGKPACNRAS